MYRHATLIGTPEQLRAQLHAALQSRPLPLVFSMPVRVLAMFLCQMSPPLVHVAYHRGVETGGSLRGVEPRLTFPRTAVMIQIVACVAVSRRC